MYYELVSSAGLKFTIRTFWVTAKRTAQRSVRKTCYYTSTNDSTCNWPNQFYALPEKSLSTDTKTVYALDWNIKNAATAHWVLTRIYAVEKPKRLSEHFASERD